MDAYCMFNWDDIVMLLNLAVWIAVDMAVGMAVDIAVDMAVGMELFEIDCLIVDPKDVRLTVTSENFRTILYIIPALLLVILI